MTGFSSWEVLRAFYRLVCSWIGGEETLKQHNQALEPLDQFFFTMCILRSGSSEARVILDFGISTATGSRYFRKWIRLLAQVLRWEMPYPSRSKVQERMPFEFEIALRSDKLRIIVDATEVQMEKPSRKVLDRHTFSNYKHRNTVKFLVGVSPDGCIIYVSLGYGGSISDIDLTKCCGLAHALQRCDEVMGDKGFHMHDFFANFGVHMVMPPKKGRGQAYLTEEQIQQTRCIARLRIHVERAMGRIRQFGFFNNKVKITQVDLISDIFYVCAMLSNFQPPLSAGPLNKS